MSTSTKAKRVAVLGTGVLGAAIATNLARRGFEVRVWNRTASKAAELESENCSAMTNPAEAVLDVDFVLTVLADGPTTEQLLFGAGVADAIRDPTMLVQVGTVGEETTTALAEEFRARGVGFVDSPVSGSQQPALTGELVVLASADPSLRPKVQPLLDAMGRKTIWSDTVGDGTRLKLAINSWLGLSLHALAEVVALCRTVDLDPTSFLDAIQSGPLDMPYAQSRGRAMSAEIFSPAAFPLKLLVKDLALALMSAESRSDQVSLPALRLAIEQASAVCAAGYADEDMTAIYRATRTLTDGPGNPGTHNDR